MRIALIISLLAVPAFTQAQEPIEIGPRRELFVDGHLIDNLVNAQQRLHHPVPREIAIVHDALWEGAGCGYHSVFHDGELYRMYYRGSELGIVDGQLKMGSEAYCYAESNDGIRWTRPDLGLFEYNGSKKNNIIWMGVGVHNFTPFLDTRPDCPPESRFKALAGDGAREGGLYAFQSPDGIHWSLMSDKLVITNGAFDSQNLAFWDSTCGMYRAYWRCFSEGSTTKQNWNPAGYRGIRTATSHDFLNWTDEADLTYQDSPDEHLYTNQIKPYYRAPHILIGFPARYIDRGWSKSMRALPEREHREMRAQVTQRYGTAITEGLLMASRDGVNFKRWNEAFLPPGVERPGTWIYTHQFMAWHLVETESSLPGAPNELSMYATESGWTGKSNALRRYTLRLDGFVSVNSPMSGGEVVTKLLTFSGSKLKLNFATSAAGSIRVEIQDLDGKPIEGFSLVDCADHFGDTVERIVTWKNGEDVSALEGRAVRLRFKLKDADLYSFQFSND
jgi:hypothetical protein